MIARAHRGKCPDKGELGVGMDYRKRHKNHIMWAFVSVCYFLCVKLQDL